VRFAIRADFVAALLPLDAVLGAFLGAVVSLALAVTYQDRIHDWVARQRRVRRARALRRVQVVDHGPIQIGGHQSAVHLVEGDGTLVLDEPHLIVHLRESGVELPEFLEVRRQQIGAQLANRRAGTVQTWDSPHLIALNAYRISRSATREDAILELDCTQTDYATFAATVLGLDDELDQTGIGYGANTTLRQTFLSADRARDAIDHPIPFLANGVGVALLAFTDDGQVILGRRRSDSRARPGGLDVSVVEGVHALYDAIGPTRLSVEQACVRGT
jgi:hypothetical protein